MGDPGTPAQAADAEAPAGERRPKLKTPCCAVPCVSTRSNLVLRSPVRALASRLRALVQLPLYGRDGLGV